MGRQEDGSSRIDESKISGDGRGRRQISFCAHAGGIVWLCRGCSRYHTTKVQ